MEIFLISNNLYENHLSFASRDNIEKKKLARPLSIIGERTAKNIAVMDEFSDVTLLYSSMYASDIASAKYLADKLDKNIIIDEKINDQVIGDPQNKSLKMIKFMQDHDFDIKLNGGESLNEVKDRMVSFLNKIFYLNLDSKIVIFTHRRNILGLLLKYGKAGYNMEDELIIEYNNEVVFSEEEKDADIVKISYDGKNVYDIKQIIL